MEKVIILFSMLTFLSFASLTQTTATTENGKKVILNEDGTWHFEKSIEKETIDGSLVKTDCDKYISTEVDKMTGESSVASNEILIISKDGGKKGFGIYLMKSKRGSIILSIQAVGAGNCIDDDNKMNILFRDGTRLELTNDSKFNCDAKYTQYFGGSFGKKDQLEMLRSKEVETIRVWTSNSYVEEDFTSEQSKTLLKTFDCLVSE